MKRKFNFLILIITTCVFACGLKGKNVDNDSTGDKKNLTITIDTFSIIPSEIDGCSCYFSNNQYEFKNHYYIYVNDFAQISFIRINGILTKFTQTEFKKIDNSNTEAKAVSKDFQLLIKVKHGQQSGDETEIQSGTIKISDKKGNKIEKTFYGECGC
jgi:hypothetical protein